MLVYTRFLSLLFMAILLSVFPACGKKKFPDEKYDKDGNFIPYPLQDNTCDILNNTPPNAMVMFWLGLGTRGKPPDYWDGKDFIIKLPMGYINSNLRKGYQIIYDGAVMVSARFPDFAPHNARLFDLSYYSPNTPEVSTKYDEAFAKKHKYNGRWIYSKVTMVWGGLAPPDSNFDHYTVPEKRGFIFENVFYHERFTKRKPAEYYKDVEIKLSPYGEGLYELDPDIKYERDSMGAARHFFVFDDTGKTTEHIECEFENPFERGRDKTMDYCQHRFFYRGIKMKLRYDFHFLDHWEETGRKARELLDCAIIDVKPRPKVSDKSESK